MKPLVLLFDIDGTLITTGGVGRRALELAFTELHGREDACQSFRLDGMTDRAIGRQALTAIGLEPTDAAIDAVLARYLQHLEQTVRGAPEASYRVHPGMREAVAWGRQHGHAVGLGTGNVKRGAQLKLERVGLWEHFDFGGFGDDAEPRAELIAHGARRGRERLNDPQAEVIVIGDTPKDVLAAQAIGARCLGVGTSVHTPAQLLAAGATWAFASLAVAGPLDALFFG